MAETKIITLDGLKKFKELLDDSYSEKFADKSQAAGGGSTYNYASDEEVENLLDDIFGVPSSTGTEEKDEVEELLDNIFG